MNTVRPAKLPPALKRSAVLMVIVLAHTLFLFGAWHTLVPPRIPDAKRPLEGTLISPPIAAMAPEPVPPKPHVSVKPPPEPKPPTIKPMVKPVPVEPTPVLTTQATPSAPVEPVISATATPVPAVAEGFSEPNPPTVIPPRSDAAQLNNPKPDYPTLSRSLGEEGKVLLRVYILANGEVGELKLEKSSGYSRLDDAATRAVRKWHYVPARQGNTPIAYWYIQPIVFNLNR